MIWYYKNAYSHKPQFSLHKPTHAMQKILCGWLMEETLENNPFY